MFRSAEQAIRFAFRVRGKAVMSRMRFEEFAVSGGTATDRLTAYDFHAMSGMVFSIISRQAELEQAVCYLVYGEPHEKQVAAKLIAEAENVQLPKHLKTRGDLAKALLSKSVRECSRECGVSHYKAWRVRQSAWGIVEPHLIRLHECIESRLKLDDTGN